MSCFIGKATKPDSEGCQEESGVILLSRKGWQQESTVHNVAWERPRESDAHIKERICGGKREKINKEVKGMKCGWGWGWQHSKSSYEREEADLIMQETLLQCFFILFCLKNYWKFHMWDFLQATSKSLSQLHLFAAVVPSILVQILYLLPYLTPKESWVVGKGAAKM